MYIHISLLRFPITLPGFWHLMTGDIMNQTSEVLSFNGCSSKNGKQHHKPGSQTKIATQHPFYPNTTALAPLRHRLPPTAAPQLPEPLAAKRRWPRLWRRRAPVAPGGRSARRCEAVPGAAEAWSATRHLQIHGHEWFWFHPERSEICQPSLH